MAEVFSLKNQCIHVGCVNQRPQSNINKDIMKSNKNYSPLVEIESTVEQLREGLLHTGRSLQALLKAAYPDADAICVAVEEIKDLLEDICDRWVTAHVVVDDKSRFITNLLVRKVSILLLICFYCA